MADEFLTEEETSIVSHAIDLGSDLSGSVAGAGLGLLLAGPPGALAGAAAGPILKKSLSTLGDVIRRTLSKREGQRILAGANAAIFQIQYRLDAGYKPREDGFFTDDECGNRSAAAELFEGSLLKCRDSYQEKKIKFLANIFATTAFDAGMPPDEANHILNLAQRLTYRQLSFVAVLKRRGDWELLNRNANESYSEPIISDISALEELHELYYVGLLRSSDGTSSDSDAILGIEEITPARLSLTTFGERFHEALDLKLLDDADIEKIVSLLQGR